MFGKRKKMVEEEDVDLTPMIDVTFLMLIFFMVTSTPDQKTEIKLAEALHGSAVSQRESVIISVAFAGLAECPVYGADGKIPSAILSSDLEKQKEQIIDLVTKGRDDGKTNVIIKADKAVAYRNIDRVIKSISATEGIKLHLAVLDSD